MIHEDRAIAPYLTGQAIVGFFGSMPRLDVSGQTLGTRWRYVEHVLRSVNDSEDMQRVVEAAVQPVRFLHTPFSAEDAVEYLNDYLTHDGYRLRRAGKTYRVVLAEDESLVPVAVPAGEHDALSHKAIVEQIEKAEDRIERQDFDGAITLARSLLETVLRQLDERLPGDAIDAKGDLLKLFKAVQKKLNLDPKDHDLESLQKILRGLTSVIDGLAGIRNRMGDAHARTFKAHRHHAVLAVNAARTVTMFLFATQGYQSALKSP